MAKRTTIQEYTPTIGMRLVPVGISPLAEPGLTIDVIETRGEGDALEIRVQHGSRRTWQRRRTWAERYRPVDVASKPVQSALPLPHTSLITPRDGELMPAHSLTEERVREIVREELLGCSGARINEWLRAEFSDMLRTTADRLMVDGGG